jgi:trehalose 6-phosphate synthase
MADLVTSRLDQTAVKQAWHEGYIPLNDAFAQSIAHQASREPAPLLMLHDYHLYLTASLVRERVPWATIGHFVHIPWPETEGWRLLPSPIPAAIHAGMCASDVVGMQTPRDVRNFLSGCRDLLGDAQVDFSRRRIEWRGHVTEVRAYPISIDPRSLRERSSSPEVRNLVARLLPHCGERTIVRVDRLDPTKNVARGFQALELLLAQRPDLLGRVRLLAFLVPSRTSIPEYQAYYQQTLAAANAVNARFGNDKWQPVEIFYKDNYAQAIAAMTLYDVLLVNPMIDGMNLVSKEGPTVNERDGVLVLSKTAGSFGQLQRGALAIDPEDVAGTAAALSVALDMPMRERAERQLMLRQAVGEFDITTWLDTQIRDLSSCRSSGRPFAGVRSTEAWSLPIRSSVDRVLEHA